MNKQEILSLLEKELMSGTISKKDVLNAIDSSNTSPVQHEPDNTSNNLINTLYAIGASIAVIGVAILIAQNWNDIGFLGRVVATLGIAVVTYSVGLVMNKPEHRSISQIFFMIATVLSPLGAYVLLDEVGVDFNSSTQVVVSFVLAIVFGFAFFVSKRNLLSLSVLMYASWMYYALIFTLFDIGYRGNADILKWATLLLGIAYVCIGYGYRSFISSVPNHNHLIENERISVQNTLYALGSLAVLGAGISVGGAFDVLFIAIIFATFYGSVFLKSRAMLVFSAIFLMAHIIKLTSKYFVDSIGWPVALIIVGFLVIGIGYATFYINQRFISVRK